MARYIDSTTVGFEPDITKEVSNANAPSNSNRSQFPIFAGCNYFCGGDVVMKITNSLVSGILADNFECETSIGGLTTYMSYEDDCFEIHEIRVIRTVGQAHESNVGIHLHSLEDLSELEYHLVDAVNTCFKDGFDVIYIHDGVTGLFAQPKRGA